MGQEASVAIVREMLESCANRVAGKTRLPRPSATERPGATQSLPVHTDLASHVHFTLHARRGAGGPGP